MYKFSTSSSKNEKTKLILIFQEFDKTHLQHWKKQILKVFMQLFFKLSGILYS